MLRLGVDVGGTFTDFTLLDGESGAVRFFKVESTPSDPSEAIENGLRQMVAAFAIDPGQIEYFGHGTTVATNLVIERRGARTGLITTKGFRDVLELGRQARPSIYDYRMFKPAPLVPRERRVEVTERVGPDGNTLIALDDESLDNAVRALADQRVEAVAICFLHSYRDPAHERRARAAVERLLPGVYVSISSDILPEFREYERVSTTVVNAFIGPRMGRYLERFRERVRSLGVPVEPYTIHSNGGLMSVDTVRRTPVRTCVSGPAAGVVGAAAIGMEAGLPDLITFDVGGTSTDVSLIDKGQPLYTSNRMVAGYPVKTPMIDIHVIGAGGGSIAALDDAGALKVGPRSAGAEPGPMAYGRGGNEPTLTDANLCLGRLDPDTLLGGRMHIDLEAARRGIAEQIAKPLGLSVEQAAHGIIQIANANMSRAIRSVSVERGYDLSGFALCAFGGAGPLHAAEVAMECNIPSVLIPREPGTLCARGMLLTDLSSDYVRSHFGDGDAANWALYLRLFAEMTVEGEAWLALEGIEPARRQFRHVVDARYRGQNFEIKTQVDGLGADDLDQVVERFHAAHKREYGYEIRDRGIEFVSCRLQVLGIVPKPPPARVAGGADLAGAETGRRRFFVDAASGWCDGAVYAREKLPVGLRFPGPAVVNEMSATTLIMPGQTAIVDIAGNLIVRIAS